MKSSIIAKISVITLAALILLAIIGGAAWIQFNRVIANQETMAVAASAMRNQLEADMMHDALRSDVLAAFNAAASANDLKRKEAEKSLAEHAKFFREKIAENKKIKLSPAAEEAIVKIGPSLENYISSAEKIVASIAKDAVNAETELPAFTEAFTQLKDKLVSVSDEIEQFKKDTLTANGALVSGFQRTLLTAGLIGVVVLVVLTIFIARSVPGPFRKVVSTLSATAQGANATSKSVASASQQLATGASESAASLEETSASLEEISAMIKRTADNAQSARQLANESRNSADAGSTDMQAMTIAMSEIKASSDNIAKIIKTIDEIAFQTNLLALNAAVEAARAGEAGAGFAVVADEVRALAQRSALAAKETAALIEDSIAKSNRGVNLSEKVSGRLADIVSRTRVVNELVTEIAGATSEQSQGILQINAAISQFDKVTQDNAANSNTIASASVQLCDQAAELNSGVSELGKLVGGVSTSASTPNDAAAPTNKQSFTASNKRSKSAPAPVAPNRDVAAASPTYIPTKEEYGNAKVPAGFADF